MTRVVVENGLDVLTILGKEGVQSWLGQIGNSERPGAPGKISEGFGAVGVALPEAGIFLRLPKENNGWKDVVRSIDLAKIPNQMGLALLTKHGELIDCTEGQELNVDEGGIEAVLHVLSLMPEGLDLLDQEIKERESDLIGLYGEIGRQIGQVHSNRERPDNEDEWRVVSTRHIVEGHERLDDVLSVVRGFEDQSWADWNQIARVREKMMRAAIKQNTSGVNLVRSHGDLWEANVRVTGEGEVVLFDQALGYAPAGLDVGFMIGKQMIGWLANGDEGCRRMIESFLQGYVAGGGDREQALTDIFNPLVFKMIVGAAFDGYDNKIRSKLVDTAEKLVDWKLENTKGMFNLELIEGLWRREGLSCSQTADVCLPENGLVLTSNVLSQDFLPIVDVLAMMDLTKEELSAAQVLFNQNGEWIYSLENQGLYKMNKDQLLENLGEILSPVYSLVDNMLNHGHKNGFNSHDWQTHVRGVAIKTGRMLEMLGASDDEVADGIIAAASHDIGNLTNRRGHNFSSAIMLKKILPELTEDKERWQRISRAIEFHELNKSGVLLQSLANKVFENKWSIENVLTELNNQIGMVGLVLLVADKTDIGTSRIGLQATPEAVDQDIHYLLNMLGESEALVFGRDRFTWTIRFTPEPEGDAEKRFPQIVRKSKDRGELRWTVPDHIRELYRIRQINQFDIWRNNLLTVYFKEVRMVLFAGMAINPSCNECQIKFVDGDELMGEFHQININRFSLTDWFDGESLPARKYVPKSERKTWPTRLT